MIDVHHHAEAGIVELVLNNPKAINSLAVASSSRGLSPLMLRPAQKPLLSRSLDEAAQLKPRALILRRAAASVAELTEQGTSVLVNHDPCPPLKFYKNNVDGKGAG